jgi:2-polyprenyl-3-methyl-5-hydroxy-6-metoxy-1,4-benzoquinol methylase
MTPTLTSPAVRDLATTASKEEILEFVERTSFSGYQGLTLPHGITIPGRNLAPLADAVFPADLSGKRVLEIGCYYGFFLHEARRRGAEAAVGVEINPERAAVAREIARLTGDGVEIITGDMFDPNIRGRFDIVLFLNVMHHVTEPVAVVRRLCTLSRQQVVVAFVQTPDPHYLRQLVPVWERHQYLGRKVAKMIVPGLSWMLRVLERMGIPLVAVGNRPYHKTFYFSQPAFRNLFETHLGLFSKITFTPSPHKHRAIAFCQVAQR